MYQVSEYTNEHEPLFGKGRKITIKPNLKNISPLVDSPEHEAAFLFGSSTWDLELPKNRRNVFVDPFVEGEREWLEREMGVDLNPNRRTDNFFEKYKVKLRQETRVLNLDRPDDYLAYCVLRSAWKQIVPVGEKDWKKRKTWKFGMISENQEVKQRALEVDEKIAVYKAVAELADDKQAMIDFLTVYGKRPSHDARIEWLKDEVDKIANGDPKGFLRTYRDKENYEYKLFVQECVQAGFVTERRKGGVYEYHLLGGDALCGPGSKPTMDNVVAYLKNPANQEDVYLPLKTKLEDSKD